MGQNTSHQDQVEPEQRERLVSESVNRPASDDLDRSDWLPLDDDEEVVWEGSPDFKSVVSSLLLSIVIVGIGVLLVAIKELQLLNTLSSTIQLTVVVIGGLAAALGIGFLLFSYWSYRRRRYAITTEAAYRKWGSSVSRIGMEEICSVSTKRYSWLDRPFSCADLKIHWSEDGRKKTTYPAVPDPKRAQGIIVDIATRKQMDQVKKP